MPKHPFHSEPTNDSRRNLARLTLAHYLKVKNERGDDGTADIVDLIADMLHLVQDIQPTDRTPEMVLESALMHFQAETNGEG